MSIDLEEYKFSIGLVALIFFDSTAKWLRYHEKRFINDQGQSIGERKDNNRGGDRYYTLEDIRQIAFILRRRGILTDQALRNCIKRIDSMRSPVFVRRKRAKL